MGETKGSLAMRAASIRGVSLDGYAPPSGERARRVRDNTKRDMAETLKAACASLEIWAGVLADEDDDQKAAEALRLRNLLERYWGEFSP